MPTTSPETSVARRPADLVVPLALFAVTLIVFSPALGNGWLDYDDDRNFLQQPALPRARPGPAPLHVHRRDHGHWTPVTWLTLGLDYVLWGMNPLGYHLGNILLHAANAALFFVIARRLLAAARPHGRRLGAARLGALAAAALFALHPLRAESVAWITERRDVLSAFFYLLAALTYLPGGAEDGRRSTSPVVSSRPSRSSRSGCSPSRCWSRCRSSSSSSTSIRCAGWPVRAGARRPPAR